MKNKLKQFRVNAGMTQSEVAAAAGVTQPSYQRWESGATSIPEAKLEKLATTLNTDPKTLLGRHPPIRTHIYDSSADADLSYYGEVAIHFSGKGAPLLLSISEGEFSRINYNLQMDNEFVAIESLANQTVIIRTKAIADLYFSSEAYDDYGPENDSYTDNLNFQMPDSRDWEIVEAFATEGIGLEDFDQDHVKRIQERIMITDDQYKELVADGLIKPEDLEKERAKNQAKTDLLFNNATYVFYQLSTGQQRSVYIDSDENIFNAFANLIDSDGGDPAENMIRLEAESYHRLVFINKNALDYVAIPSHKYNNGQTDSLAIDLDRSEG